MTLDDYLRTDGVSAKALAAELGISEASVARIRRGEQNITRETIRQIVAATGGQVSAAELVFDGLHAPGNSAAAAHASPGKAGDISHD